MAPRPHYTPAAEPDAAARSELAAFPQHVQQLLFNRGVTTRATADVFLNPDYDAHLHEPMLLPGMPAAVDRILNAMEQKEHIAIFSDYDCDGIPGGVVLHDFFREVGYEQFSNYIPHRHDEGFGLSVTAVDRLAERGATLIITIDCGTTDHEAIEHAQSVGIDVIVTDHHEPSETVPPAVAIVNPKLTHEDGSTYPFMGLCGAGVVFKLVQALIQKGNFDITEGREKWWLDMVGIATIADMVPLTGENRVLAHYGLHVLRKSRRPGLQHLLRKSRTSQRHLTEDDIGFIIGPRINAASRMDTPEDAFHMLATRDETEAGTRVAHLETLNNERKGVVAAMSKELKKRMRALDAVPRVIVLGDPEWRPALVGLAANSIAEEYARPVFLWGRDGNAVIKGSCRSDGNVSVVRLMEAAREAFTEFGGHHASGGFSVREGAIHTLSDVLNNVYETVSTEVVPELRERTIDLDLTIDEVNDAFIRDLASLAPFGTGNAKPLLRFTDVEVESVEQFGKTKDHLKLRVRGTNRALEAIAFFTAADTFTRAPEAGTRATVLGHVEQSFFMNRLQTRIRIVDIV